MLLVRSDISANREGVRHQCEKLLVQSDISVNREGVRLSANGFYKKNTA